MKAAKWIISGVVMVALIFGGVYQNSRIERLESGVRLMAEHETVTQADVDAKTDIFAKFRDFIPWVSIDGFDISGNDALFLIVPHGAYLEMRTGNVADNDARIFSSAWHEIIESGKKVTLEFFIQYLYSDINQNIWLRMDIGATDPPDETHSHFGWKIIGADLYTSNANGITQTITDTGVNLTTGWQWTLLKIVLNPGTDCKFYVNNELKVTHDTNLPVAFTDVLFVQLRTLEADFKHLYLGRVLIEKEY